MASRAPAELPLGVYWRWSVVADCRILRRAFERAGR